MNNNQDAKYDKGKQHTENSNSGVKIEEVNVVTHERTTFYLFHHLMHMLWSQMKTVT